MKKQADTLAREYEVGNDSEDFYNYIIDTLINGQRQHVRDLFNMMDKHSKSDFLINHLDNETGYHISCKNICIDELIY